MFDTGETEVVVLPKWVERDGPGNIQCHQDRRANLGLLNQQGRD